jgi:hypothetical protein
MYTSVLMLDGRLIQDVQVENKVSKGLVLWGDALIGGSWVKVWTSRGGIWFEREN